MVSFLRLLVGLALSAFRSRAGLTIEIALLRHQLLVAKRTAPKRFHLTSTDKLIFVWVYRLWPALLASIIIVKPDTVLRWHRAGFRAFWRWKSRSRGGRPNIPANVRDLIARISLENRLWGAPRIHGELLKLGIDVSQATVARYMVRHPDPPSQGWRTFLRNHASEIVAIDLFTVPTIGFKLLFGLVVLRLDRRSLVFVNVTANPTAEWIARQLTEAFPWEAAPSYLIRDRDASYGRIFLERLQSMGIRDRPTTPRSPWQNAYAERLIGTIRRDCLDHVVVFGEGHVRRILQTYTRYYNAARTHLSLDKDAPDRRPIQRIGHIVSLPFLNGLHHQYMRI